MWDRVSDPACGAKRRGGVGDIDKNCAPSGRTTGSKIRSHNPANHPKTNRKTRKSELFSGYLRNSPLRIRRDILNRPFPQRTAPGVIPPDCLAAFSADSGFNGAKRAMANKIGRFEILSEIVHSEFSAVYKAADPDSGQTIALKTIQLQMLGDQAPVLVDQIVQEAETTKPLNSHNIALLYGLEEIEGQFCAAMEYVQGNSIGTMLARNEGFSIWDLQDIARQTCQGLDHAHSHRVVHYSLEPAKIMVTWDGTVKVLSFGASSMGAFTCQAAGKAPEVLHYVSPEQLRGDPVDSRSNMFSLGAILYEMVTETKAFAGDDAEQVRQAIHEFTPPAPAEINSKIHPALSEVIMKALAKSPEERYQSGQDLVNDLERCKESAPRKEARKIRCAGQGIECTPGGKTRGFRCRCTGCA